MAAARARKAGTTETQPADVIARVLGITPREVQQLAAAGVLPRAGPGRYRLVPCVQAYTEHLRARSAAPAETPATSDAAPLVERPAVAAPPPAEDLSERERLFVEAYVADQKHNGTRAAIAAGCSERSARSTACEILSRPQVRAAIRAALGPDLRRYRLTKHRVLRELATMAFSDLADYRVAPNGAIQLAAGTQPRATRALQTVKRRSRTHRSVDGSSETTHEVELRLWDKTRALSLAMKSLGLLIDRVEVKETPPQRWVIGGREIVF